MALVDFRNAMREALRQATPFTLDRALACDQHFAVFGRDHVPRKPPTKAERQFRQAATHGLAAIPRRTRDPALNATTGHIAGSITETLLAESVWTIVAQQQGDISAGHGIDLAALTPEMDSLFVIEVKGSLAAARWPQLSQRDLTQFSPAWLDKSDQPGMDARGVEAAEVFGLVVTIQFGLGRWKAAATADFISVHPILDFDQLVDTTWLTATT